MLKTKKTVDGICVFHTVRCWKSRKSAMLDQRGFITRKEEPDLHIKRPRGLMNKASDHGAGDCQSCSEPYCGACLAAACSRPCCGAFPALLQGAPCPAVGCSVPCRGVFLAKRCWAAKHSQVENCLSRSFRATPPLSLRAKQIKQANKQANTNNQKKTRKRTRLQH